MASPARTLPWSAKLPSPLPADELPILYQEEEDEGMGEATLHLAWTHIFFFGLKAHLATRPELEVYSNLNVYYRKGPLHPKTKLPPNVAADAIVVQPFAPLPVELTSYAIGEDGPAPLLAAEVLSEETARKRDLGKKLSIYGGLAIAEYLLADPTGRFLRGRLLLKRLRADHTWEDRLDPDGGITSALGFRVIIDTDQHPRLIDAASGEPYLRPDEAMRLAHQYSKVQAQVQALKAELERLRRPNDTGESKSGKKGPRRRKP